MDFEIVQANTWIYDVGSIDATRIMKNIEYFARKSHRSNVRQTDESWKRFLEHVVIARGDWSVTEHEKVTVEGIVDRGIQQEWTRHRLGAYTIESTRFVNYAKEHTHFNEPAHLLRFICPPHIEDDPRHFEYWQDARKHNVEEYEYYIQSGLAPEDARNCLPLCTGSEMIATYNLRMWRHFFLMRTTREAQYQMREVAINLLQEFQMKFPLLYDDIVPGQSQRYNMSLPS